MGQDRSTRVPQGPILGGMRGHVSQAQAAHAKAWPKPRSHAQPRPKWHLRGHFFVIPGHGIRWAAGPQHGLLAFGWCRSCVRVNRIVRIISGRSKVCASVFHGNFSGFWHVGSRSNGREAFLVNCFFYSDSKWFFGHRLGLCFYDLFNRGLRTNPRMQPAAYREQSVGFPREIKEERKRKNREKARVLYVIFLGCF